MWTSTFTTVLLLSLPFGVGSFSIEHVYTEDLPIPADPELHVTWILECTKSKKTSAPLWHEGVKYMVTRKAKKMKTCEKRQKERHGEKASGWHSSPWGQPFQLSPCPCCNLSMGVDTFLLMPMSTEVGCLSFTMNGFLINKDIITETKKICPVEKHPLVLLA